jgi:hypothetical protein
MGQGTLFEQNRLKSLGPIGPKAVLRGCDLS